MAFTISQVISNTVIGNIRMAILNVTPDATTGVVDMAAKGMPRLLAVVPSIKSMASFVNSGSTRNVAVIALNAGALGTTIAGSIAMTGCIANDVYTLVCFGES